MKLVDLWLCIGDCKCFDGGASDLWHGYGDEVLNPFERTKDSKEGRSATGMTTYPLMFTSNEAVAVRSFEECYTKHLLPKRRYETARF